MNTNPSTSDFAKLIASVKDDPCQQIRCNADGVVYVADRVGQCDDPSDHFSFPIFDPKTNCWGYTASRDNRYVTSIKVTADKYWQMPKCSGGYYIDNF